MTISVSRFEPYLKPVVWIEDSSSYSQSQGCEAEWTVVYGGVEVKESIQITPAMLDIRVSSPNFIEFVT